MFNFGKIKLLNDDTINNIWNYINPIYKLYLNKYFYEQHHAILSQFIPTTTYHRYIQEIIKKDYGYVFENILDENFENWKNNNKRIICHYSTHLRRYGNYLGYIKSICVEHNADNCLTKFNEMVCEYNKKINDNE